MRESFPLGLPESPRVGDVVHFYIVGRSDEDATRFRWIWHEPVDKALRKFNGPFAATIVFVHSETSGTVNLRVDFPGRVMSSPDRSEIVERVPFEATGKMHWTRR